MIELDLKIWLMQQIVSLDEEMKEYEKLKLPSLREKAYYYKRAYFKVYQKISALQKELC
jgi:hypothetical protein